MWWDEASVATPWARGHLARLQTITMRNASPLRKKWLGRDLPHKDIEDTSLATTIGQLLAATPTLTKIDLSGRFLMREAVRVLSQELDKHGHGLGHLGLHMGIREEYGLESVLLPLVDA